MGYSTTQRGPKIVTSGLVLYLDAANNKSYPGSGTVWNDLSISSNNGILINNPVFDNKYFSFNGVDTYIDTTYNSNISSTSQFTLNVWFKNSTYIGNAVVDSTITNVSGVVLNNNEFYISDGISGLFNLYISFNNVPSFGEWANISISYNGSNNANGIVCYINGIQDVSTINNNTPLTDPFTYNIPWSIGCPLFQDIPPLTPLLISSGYISQFMVYNKVLSAQETLQNYNALKSRFNTI